MSSPEYISPLGGCYLTYTDASGALRIIAFDATLRVVHTGESVVTEHPIDTGATIADHVRATPRRITIEAEVTNTPILAPEGVAGGVSPLPLSIPFRDLRTGVQASGGQTVFQTARVPLVGPISLGPKATIAPATYAQGFRSVAPQVLQFPTPFDRLADVYEDLNAIRLGGIEVAIVSRLTQYTRAVLISVSAPEEIADAITFTIEAKEILTARSEVVAVAPRVADLRAKPTVEAGGQGSYELPPERATTLSKITDALASYF